jgi:hypothetical protein
MQYSDAGAKSNGNRAKEKGWKRSNVENSKTMRHLKVPKVSDTLFDLEALAWWARQLSPNALAQLQQGWQGVFHRSILRLLQEPAEALGEEFDAALGRPSKELYAMSGLLLIAEFKDWTIDQAAEAWSYHADVQFALHLPRDGQYLCARTLDNYRRLLREKVEVEAIFLKVTRTLVEELELDVRRQRLDSTHVLSNMAQLGRLQLLAVGVRRFLHALQKRAPASYQSLEAALRERYAPAETRLFGLGTRQPQPREQALQQVAEDMAFLVERFVAEEGCQNWSSFLALQRLLREHCAVRENKVVVRAQSRDAQGGSVECLQNPSDPDAGYSGHKGPGHQTQLAQMLPPRDENGQIEGPGLVTACLPQSAAVRDNEALEAVLQQQKQGGLLPAELTADTTYGSDANVRACAEEAVCLISPVGGKVREKTAPKHRASRAERALKERLQQRRQEQETERWKTIYRTRSGIEGLHHALDVVTGLKALRVRGRRAVDIAILLKVSGWNILAAAKIQARRARRSAAQAAAMAKRTLQGTPRVRHQRCGRPKRFKSRQFMSRTTVAASHALSSQRGDFTAHTNRNLFCASICSVLSAQ